MKSCPLLVIPATAALAVMAAAGDARAQSPVEIDGVEASLRTQIARALPERDKPQSLFDAERLSEEAATRARAWLRAEGYYGADVTPEATETPPVARIRVQTGPRFVLAAPVATFAGGPRPEAEAAARAALTALEPGAPARAADVLRAEAAAVAALKAHGHPDAKAEPRRVVVDHAERTMSATFAFDAGPPVTLGGVRASPPELLRADFLKKLPGWERGAPYSPEALALLRRDLASTGAFAIVTTGLADEPSTDGTRDVIVRLERAKPRVLEIGAGWSTTEGAGVDASWTLRNVTRRADALTIDSTLAEQRQNLSATLTRPNAIGPGRSLRLVAAASRETTDPFERTGLAVSATVDAARRLRFAMTYGVAASGDFYSRAQGVENALVLSGFADVRRDVTDSPLDARRGYLLQARVEPSVSTGDATVVFARTTAQARGYWTPEAAPRLTFAARTRTGWIEPLGGDAADLPPDRLFYAGGGGSVRGYDFNAIFPRSNLAQAKPPGGRGLLEVSGEARGRITQRIGAAAFVDGGAAFNAVDEAGDLRWGAGVGVRYDLGFAPLRFDIAAPLSPRANDPNVAFYVSIGQAF